MEFVAKGPRMVIRYAWPFYVLDFQFSSKILTKKVYGFNALIQISVIQYLENGFLWNSFFLRYGEVIFMKNFPNSWSNRNLNVSGAIIITI